MAGETWHESISDPDVFLGHGDPSLNLIKNSKLIAPVRRSESAACHTQTVRHRPPNIKANWTTFLFPIFKLFHKHKNHRGRHETKRKEAEAGGVAMLRVSLGGCGHRHRCHVPVPPEQAQHSQWHLLRNAQPLSDRAAFHTSLQLEPRGHSSTGPQSSGPRHPCRESM